MDRKSRPSLSTFVQFHAACGCVSIYKIAPALRPRRPMPIRCVLPKRKFIETRENGRESLTTDVGRLNNSTSTAFLPRGFPSAANQRGTSLRKLFTFHQDTMNGSAIFRYLRSSTRIDPVAPKWYSTVQYFAVQYSSTGQKSGLLRSVASNG